MPWWKMSGRTPSCTSPRSRTWTAAFSRRNPWCAPITTAPSRCWKPRGGTRSRASCTSPPTKSTGAWQAPAEADELYPLNASSPYSASKAASDLLARSYFVTFKLPVVITRASNNYGPYQFPEKLIPLMITNALEDRTLPVYGDGQQVRDWLYVEDHCRGILAVLRQGRDGEIYNIGGNRSLPNLEVVHQVLTLTGKPESLIEYVKDRPGHDRRYALSSEKLMRETGWQPVMNFETGLALSIAWYRDNAAWVSRVRSGEYRTYYERNYGNRTPVS